MKHLFSFLFFLGLTTFLFGQNIALDSTTVDDKYREDQFYISVTYNLLGSKPDGVSQNGFSSGFHLGFIRDMPINKNRNVAVGLGFGLSTNSYNQTLLISKNTDQTLVYSILDKNVTPFSKNKFTTYLLEFPIELRWRTSNPIDYNFWRIYTGFKLGYLFYNSSKHKGSNGDIIISNLNDFNKFHYGLSISIGYSNVNGYVYYALNDIFKKEAKVNDQRLAMNAFKIGLIYYIL